MLSYVNIHTVTEKLVLTSAISMPYCQAYGCSNKKYEEKDGQLRNYFTFPWIEKDKLRLERWLHNIGTGLQAKTFKWSKIVLHHPHAPRP